MTAALGRPGDRDVTGPFRRFLLAESILVHPYVFRCQGNKLRICWFSAYCAAGDLLKLFQSVILPGIVDGVSHTSFNSAGSGIELFGHIGIDVFCDIHRLAWI